MQKILLHYNMVLLLSISPKLCTVLYSWYLIFECILVDPSNFLLRILMDEAMDLNNEDYIMMNSWLIIVLFLIIYMLTEAIFFNSIDFLSLRQLKIWIAFINQVSKKDKRRSSLSFKSLVQKYLGLRKRYSRKYQKNISIIWFLHRWNNFFEAWEFQEAVINFTYEIWA